MPDLSHLFAGLATSVALLGAALLANAGGPAARPAGKLFVDNVLSRDVQAIDLATGRLLAKFKTGILPHEMTLSPDGAKVYVSNLGSQSLSVIETRELRQLADVTIGEAPDNAAHRQVGLARVRGTNCLDCHAVKPVGTMPNAMAWLDDQRLLITETTLRAVSTVDPTSGRVLGRVRYELPGQVTPAELVIVPRTGEVWVFHRFEDFLGDAHGRPLPVPAKRPAPPPAGQHPSWLTVHAPGMGAEQARLKQPWGVPSKALVSPDGRWVYVSFRSTNRIGVYDTGTHALARTITTSVAPTGLALSPDGRKLYTACSQSDPAVVQEIEAGTGEVIRSLGLPPSPEMVAFDPLRGEIFVTLAGSNLIARVDPRLPKLLATYPAGHQPLELLLAP
jgi:YVTN family beta-propeller protein